MENESKSEQVNKDEMDLTWLYIGWGLIALVTAPISVPIYLIFKITQFTEKIINRIKRAITGNFVYYGQTYQVSSFKKLSLEEIKKNYNTIWFYKDELFSKVLISVPNQNRPMCKPLYDEKGQDIGGTTLMPDDFIGYLTISDFKKIPKKAIEDRSVGLGTWIKGMDTKDLV